LIVRFDRGLLADDRLWFPGLGSILATAAHFGGSDDRVGSKLEIPAHPGAPTANSAGKSSEVRVGCHHAHVAAPSAAQIAEFDDMNFADISDRDVTAEVQSAADLLDRVVTLSDTVGAVVDTVHPLRAPAEHDVSYSTPEMPFTVFLSIPRVGERDVTLRVAEALLHEAMHLQLTLLDRAMPLTVSGDARGYSPWKQEDRPILGLIHGLYVFAVISQALGAALGDADEPGRRYRDRRRAEIGAEVATLPPRPIDLSKFGAELWERCLRAVATD
jgi:HEXXH motif-containing protein